MAIRRDFTAADKIFLADDTDIVLSIFLEDEVTPVDVATWGLSWVLRKKDKSPNPPLIEKTTGASGSPGFEIEIDGVYNVDPAINTQTVIVHIYDTDCNADSLVTRAGKYRHSLKRMDDGSEKVLTFGDFVFLQSTNR